MSVFKGRTPRQDHQGKMAEGLPQVEGSVVPGWRLFHLALLLRLYN